MKGGAGAVRSLFVECGDALAIHSYVASRPPNARATELLMVRAVEWAPPADPGEEAEVVPRVARALAWIREEEDRGAVDENGAGPSYFAVSGPTSRLPR